MLTAEPAPPVAGDRRTHTRIAYVRPCKIFSPSLQRYFLGTTQDLSSGGMLVQVPHPVDVRPGDTLQIGVASKRREQMLRAAEMLRATVIRSMTTVNDHTTFAVRFEQEQNSVESATLRLAA
jgi:hypothetical protein